MKRSLTLVSLLIANFFVCVTSSAQLSDALMLTVSSGAYSDQTAIRFLDVATNYFDSEWDAYKLQNMGNTPNFCSNINNQTYSINALNRPDALIEQRVPLNLAVAFSGLYTITAEEIGLFSSGCTITLIDNVLKKRQDLKANAVYAFNFNIGDRMDRFSVVFKEKTPQMNFFGLLSTSVQGVELELQGVKVYNTLGTIRVELESSQAVTQISINDMSGNALVLSSISNTGTWEYTPRESNIYIVSLVIDGNMYTEKLYVQR